MTSAEIKAAIESQFPGTIVENKELADRQV